MPRYLMSILICLAFATSAEAVKVKVTIKGEDLGHRRFAEFKVESDQKGEQATGHVADNGEHSWEWDVGASNQNIWYWWDKLDGSAHLTVSVDGTVIFDGNCGHVGVGEVNVKDTCKMPTTYAATGSPYLVERPNKKCRVTHILFGSK